MVVKAMVKGIDLPGAVHANGSEQDGSWVYLLVRADEVVYVGQTGNLRKRLYQHRKDRWVIYSEVYYLEVRKEHRLAVEKALIELFRPAGNRDGRGNSILAQANNRIKVLQYKSEMFCSSGVSGELCEACGWPIDNWSKYDDDLED